MKDAASMRVGEQVDLMRVEPCDWWISVILTLAVSIVYHLNGGFYSSADATSSALVAESLLNEGNLSFRPEEIPDTVQWWLHRRDESVHVALFAVDQKILALYHDGILTPEDRYCDPGGRCAPTIRHHLYANSFCPGAGLTAVPCFAILRLWYGRLADHPGVLWWAGKFVASLCTAISVGFVYLTVAAFVKRRHALLIALAYGLGTCVWTISSQALWQHGPTAMYLAAGTFFLTRATRGAGYAAGCGMLYAAATWCRPTSAIVVLAAGVYLLAANRKALIAYVLAGLPFAVLMATYNAYYFGSPLRFGQTMLDWVAVYKTGSPELWQTPLPIGLAGMLFSPSRGLFVFSPVLLFAMWGMWRSWRDARFVMFRPLSVAIVAIWFVEAKHFDWWGGWSYGYRHIVDTAPLMALFFVPVVGTILQRRPVRWLFFLCLAWSVLVQVVGATAFNMESWNARKAWLVRETEEGDSRIVYPEDEPSLDGTAIVDEVMLNIDLPEYHYRLWSLRDSQVLYYLTHYSKARALRRERMIDASRPLSVRLAESHCALGDAWLQLVNDPAASDHYAIAVRYVPGFSEGVFGQGLALVAEGELEGAAAVYRKALEHSPDDVPLLLRLGAVLLLQGNTKRAFATCLRAINIDSKAIDDYNGISRRWHAILADRVDVGALNSMDEYARGLQRLRVAGRISEKNVEPLLREAALHFKSVLDEAPGLPEVHMDLGHVYLELGDLDEATASFTRAIDLAPNMADAHHGLGLCWAYQGDFDRAREQFMTAIRIDPKHLRAAQDLKSVNRRIATEKRKREAS